MTAGDLVGWLAAVWTLLAFSTRSMLTFRMAAISANLCFLAYGTLNDVYSVIALHSLLLPCNLLRLCQLHGGSLHGLKHGTSPTRSDELSGTG